METTYIKKLPSVYELFTLSCQLFKKKFAPLYLIALKYILLPLAVVASVILVLGYFVHAGFFFLILPAIFLMLYLCVRVGIASVYILYNTDHVETVSKYWEKSDDNSVSGFFFSSFGLRLLIQGGTLLLLIPGIIYSMRYMFTLPIYVLEKDSNPGFRKSLGKSRAITNGYKSSIFCKTSIISLFIILSIIILGFISFILFTFSIVLGILMSIIIGIALFIGMGVMTCMGPVIYNIIKDETLVAVPEKKSFVITLMVLGILFGFGRIGNLVSKASTLSNNIEQKEGELSPVQSGGVQIDQNIDGLEKSSNSEVPIQ